MKWIWKYRYCVYCGAKLKADKYGFYCTTENCEWSIKTGSGFSEIEKWLESRPPAIRKIAERYPPFSTFEIDGKIFYWLGYQEFASGEPGLLLSEINPAIDYDGAHKSKIIICADHLK